MKMKFRNALVVSTLALSLVACGSKVEVPAAHVAKIMTKDGYKADTIGTSKFRLDWCWAYCDKLVLLDASDQAVSEKMELFMPEDKLNMTFDLRLTMIINPNKYEELFARIPPVDQSGIDVISWNKAYITYAQQIVRAEAREFLSGFTIAEIASSREAINAQLSERLTKSINSKTPFQVRYVGLADIQYPKIIVEAQENAAERREQIQQEEAQLQISKVQLERQLQEQQLQRMVDVERALAEAEVDRIKSQSLTPQYMKYRELQILEKLATSENKVFVPSAMLDSIAGQVQLGRQ
jgi:regulator of protease activity HflC (stomatin/prohibitin superfamily)/predicted small lipoprotein YifL